jgi:hypothetical protein
LWPVRVFGRTHAGLAAIAVPSNSSITEIQAYSATGEVGYTVPFTAPMDIETVRWLKPGQPALPKPARYTIASGRIRGNPWAERLSVGPWGFCLNNTWRSDAYIDGYTCLPTSVNRPGSKAAQATVQYYSGDDLGFAVIIGPRRFSYVVARTGHASRFLVKVYRAGQARFAVVVGIGDSKTRWIGYTADGGRLGSNSF